MNPTDEIKQEQEEQIDLEDSEGMNEDQRALFLNISRSRSADSFLGRLLPHPNEVPDRDRSLVWQLPVQSQLRANNIIVQANSKTDEIVPEQASRGLKIFKNIKKEKIKSKCDYDKNICGYITKKVIRQFVGKNYEKEIAQLVKKYHCNYNQCKTYYLKKVQYVTGPSHLPELFNQIPSESATLINCKRAFKQFYRWFLKERYLRYLLLEGKMTDKMAYIEYKNNHLFKYVGEDEAEETELQNKMQTRSKSAHKNEEQEPC